MSLVAWYPLNGNMNNYGVGDADLTVTSTPTFGSGKIGQALTNGGNAKWTASQTDKILNNQFFSICFWVYVDAPTGDTTKNAMFFGNNSPRKFSIFQYSTVNHLHWSWQLNSSDTRYYGNILYNVLPSYEWTHVAITYDNPAFKVYINGELKATYSYQMAWDSYANETQVIYACQYRKLNDFRIYNECLSPKQVKLISQGLVLHYPLSDPFIEWTTNLITSEDCLSSTCYNGATSKYGYGANSDMYKTVTTFDGKKGTKVYMGTNGNQAYPYVYINNMYTSNGTNSPAYKTLSFDYYTNISTSISPYKLGSGSGTATYKVINDTVKTGTGTNSVVIPVKPNTWNHIEITFHGTTDADSQWGYIQNQPSHTSNTENFWFFANMQLEAKDHATGYTKYGTTRSDKAVYDVSGYCNNGLSSGTVAVSNNTPKYNYSTVFNGTDSYIKVNSNNWMIKGCKELTVNVWAYMDDWSTWGGRRIFSCTESGGFNTEAGDSGYIRFPICVYTSDALTNYTYIYNNKTIKLSDLSSGWHMFTFIYTTTGINAYVDGVLHSTYSSSSYGIHYNFNTNLYLGCEAATGSFSGPYFNGKESDFRIYTTALSADNILELYNTPVHLTSNGALLTSGELTEV